VALVDYDNVKVLPDKTQGNVVENLSDLIPQLVVEALAMNAGVSELLVRLYGGWRDERGQHSRNAQWALAALPWYRGRRNGVIVKPALAMSIAAVSHSPIDGTLRGWPRDPRQKMVDCMIAVDAVEFARQPLSPVLLASDDDDLVPAALAAAAGRSGALVWLRMRREGWGLNDRLLAQAGVQFGLLRGGTNGGSQ
jgi:hypothetical protein